MSEIAFDDFLKVDIRVGKVIRAEPYPKRESPRSRCGSISEMRLASVKPRPRSPHIMIRRRYSILVLT